MSFEACFADVLSYAEPQRLLLEGSVGDVEGACVFFAPYQRVLVVGTGGSSLGGQTLTAIPGASNRCLFVANIDPYGFQQLLNQCNPEETGVLVISKSGETSETLMQVQVLDVLWPGWQKRARVITDPRPNSLRSWADQHHVKVYDHAPVGGRYSVFSSVGLIPAALSGVDITTLRQAALTTFQDFAAKPHASSPALLVGQQNVEWMQKGLNILVLWVYVDALAPWAAWYAQLWAESLGKKTVDGVSVGSTPVVARGTLDQHSQLQLYLDGPDDKSWIVVTSDHQQPESSPLAPMAKLMKAHQQAVVDTFRANNLTMRHIHVPEVSARVLGEWMAYNMLEVWATAHFLGVNPLNQDAVEQVKRRVREVMLETTTR